jgi:DNA-binding NarL/FixJ family response regulator
MGSMPRESFKRRGCLAKVLFLTMHADLPLVEEAFRAGASGFVLKICETAEFVKAVQCDTNPARRYPVDSNSSEVQHPRLNLGGEWSPEKPMGNTPFSPLLRAPLSRYAQTHQ